MKQNCMQLEYFHTCSLDQELVSIEQQHGLQHRWVEQDLLYQQVLMQQKEISCKNLMKDIQKKARQRWFLLSMKAKFLGQHPLAIPAVAYMHYENFMMQKDMKCLERLLKA